MYGITHIIDILHTKGCSCVIQNGGRITEFFGRGVLDLYETLQSDPSLLAGATVADKVVGKGAAALMILGGVAQVYADVLSESAAALFTSEGIAFDCGKLVPAIINRAGTGICPVETLTADCTTAEECLPLISDFMARMKGTAK